MVTLTHLTVEDPEDGFPLLPEAEEVTTPSSVRHRPLHITRKTSHKFFISRYHTSLQFIVLYSLDTKK